MNGSLRISRILLPLIPHLVLIAGLAAATTGLQAEKVSLEMGGGIAYLDRSFVDRLGQDSLKEEGFLTLPRGLQGNASVNRDLPANYHFLLATKSNDLICNVFSRTTVWDSTLKVNSLDSNSVQKQRTKFDGRDRITGAELGQRLYFLNDRLTVIPGYGYLATHTMLQSHGRTAQTLSSPSLPAQLTVDPGNETHTRSSGPFIRIALEYQLNEDYQFVVLGRYMPSGEGTYVQKADALKLSYASPADTIFEIRKADVRGKFYRNLGSLDLKLVREINSKFYLNAGLHWQHSGTRFETKPIVGSYKATGFGSFTSSTGGGFVYLLEYLTDTRIYQHRQSENQFQAYVSVTISTGEQYL